MYKWWVNPTSWWTMENEKRSVGSQTTLLSRRADVQFKLGQRIGKFLMQFLFRMVRNTGDERKREACLILILPFFVGITRATNFFSFYKHNLRDPFTRVDFSR
jgi:hypothetical protein